MVTADQVRRAEQMLRQEAEDLRMPWHPSDGCFLNAADIGLSLRGISYYPSVRDALEALEVMEGTAS